ncbi:MAG: transglutaminase-like domain-containing protein [Desulfatibacillaceae bacterium]|nr:transglutaminase-like domain-containing protein [Desulfatibacillaceae bacterium]
MSTPFLLSGAALLFWGFTAGVPLLGFLMALFLEGSRLSRVRLNLSARDFIRISDLCALLLILVGVTLFLTKPPRTAMLMMFQWLVLPLFILVAFQAFSVRGRVPLGTVLWGARALAGEKEQDWGPSVDLSWPFFALTLFTAMVPDLRHPAVFSTLWALTAWALWASTAAKRKTARAVCAGLLVAAGLLGFVGQKGLHSFQLYLEQVSMQILEHYWQRGQDPYRSLTAIGEMGRIKLSHEIAFRIKPQQDSKDGFLLRESSHNHYRRGLWMGSHPQLTHADSMAADGRWLFGEKGQTAKSLMVSQSFSGKQGLLKLPAGVYTIGGLDSAQLLTNRFGAVLATGVSSRTIYTVEFGTQTFLDSPPDEPDLKVDEIHAPGIFRLAEALNLSGMQPKEAFGALAAYFDDNFRYSLVQEEQTNKDRALQIFLEERRSGHCEYFATAAVLLLRAAGIPARYAVGYMAHEPPGKDGWVAVRKRHAHAWALAWVDGSWVDVDVTPHVWMLYEAQTMTVWNRFHDMLSNAVFAGFLWQNQGGFKKLAPLMIALAAFLTLVLIYRFVRGARMSLVLGSKAGKKPSQKMGAGPASPFFKVEQFFAQKGFVRPVHETHAAWLDRLQKAKAPFYFDDLESIVKLHYRLRYDPQGLPETQRLHFSRKVDEWIASNNKFRQAT